MKCGVVIFPSTLIQEKVNAYRKRFDPKYTLISPHITIKRGFELSEDKLPEIVTTLKEIASQTKPFEIEINKVSHFAPVNNVIYLKVTASDELKKLHEQMYSSPLTTKKEYAFVPHITLAQELSSAEFSDIFGKLSMEQFSHTETISSFQLVYELENGSWEVYESFNFGGSK
jgi:2'-5' RNA ligase